MAKKEAPYKRLLSGFILQSDSGCWEWQGSKYKNGYGWMKVFGRSVSAHRYSYELHNGYIPDGLEVRHTCDNRCCINPDHLILGTHQENMQDAVDRGRIRKGKDHPMHGKKVERPRQSNVVMVMGKTYKSQKEAERELGLGSGTVAYWIKTNNGKAKLINKGELNGKRFKSM